MSDTLADIEKLMRDYQAWLRDKTTLRNVDETWVEITTPYLDRHNDALQIFAKRDNGGFVLTDDGYIIRDLEASGCTINTDKRRDLLQMTLNGFGVKLGNNDSLEVHASPEQFARGKHNLIQSMLAVNDLFYLAQSVVLSVFLEDVQKWLDDNRVRYTPRVKLAGATGYDHLFHFIIPKSGRHPERVVQAINKPTSDSAQSFLFEWMDTQKARQVESRAYAILNDSQGGVSPGVVDALQKYEVTPVLWSKRSNVIEPLAA